MILKAGTYRFNDVPLDRTTSLFSFVDAIIPYSIVIDGQTITDTGWVSYYAYETEEIVDEQWEGILDIDGYEVFVNGEWALNYNRNLDITKDTEVSEEFYNQFTLTTNYNEVNAKRLAEITYNGETIAQLNAGETATLSCEGKKMASDVVVKVNEVESKIPEGYVKPEGQLNVLKNNTTYDVSKYAEVRIATAQPYEVPLESLMNNIISNISQATIGNVYKYTGETSDTYEQGALYILEEVSE